MGFIKFLRTYIETTQLSKTQLSCRRFSQEIGHFLILKTTEGFNPNRASFQNKVQELRPHKRAQGGLPGT
jgi:hypothetical protein